MVYFPVNVSGIPMNQESYRRMWDFYFEKYHYTSTKRSKLKRETEEKAQLRKTKRRVPVPPIYRPRKTPHSYITKCQRYISSLTYNLVGFQLFYIDKRAPLMSLLKVAKDMIQLSMPIKCLEAVILAIHLTNEVPSMDRFTLTFKSQQNGLIYYHTVLGLFYRGRYGAIGLSRKDDLMSRPIEYADLSAMLLSFNEAYMRHNHKLLKVSIGGTIPHDPCTMERINWQKSEFQLENGNYLHLVRGRSSIRCCSKIRLKESRTG